MWEYSLPVIVLYFLGLAYFSWQRHAQDEDYILGQRSLGFWYIYGSVISYMRAGSNLIFWFAFVALMGFGSIWILISFYAAFVIMTLLAGRAHKLSVANNHITFTDLIESRQGPLMAAWINIFSFYVTLILVVSQLFVAGTVLSGLLDANIVIATILCAVIVATYIILGGFMSVVRTDLYQALSIILISALAIIFLDWPSGDVFVSEVTSPNWQMVIGFGIIGFAVPASTDMWQRFFAVKDCRVIVPATISALVTDVLVVMGLILFIQYLIGNVVYDQSNIFTSLFSGVSGHPAMIALFGIFILSAVLSTMDNQVFNLASIVSKNLLKIDGGTHKKKFVWVLRLVALISLCVFSFMALTITDLMQWIVSTYAYVGVITPFIFYGLLCQAGSDKLLAIGVFLSSILHWYMYYIGLYENMNWYALSYMCSATFCFIDFALFQRTSIKTV